MTRDEMRYASPVALINEIERLQGVIQTVANNLACGPDNIIPWSEKVKAGMLELDHLQQLKK